MKNNIPSNITISSKPAHELTEFIQKESPSALAVIVDENTKNACYPLCQNLLPDHILIEIPSGERNKGLESCKIIWDQLTNAGVDRNGLVLNLGGGVIGDMGGFCAATYKRGIPFINLPSTLLSQVDASVGGKLGIDYKRFKNHIGVFQNPEHIFIYTEFLDSLPKAELRSGFAEVVKHHLIADKKGWEQLSSVNWEDQSWEVLIPHSIQIKATIVEQDPRESGLRKVLNVGHTLGHGIESYFLDSDSPILHGEGVMAGVICENFISEKKELLNSQERAQIETYIFSQFGKIRLQLGDIQKITELILQDKKNKGTRVMASLLKSVGNPLWDQEISMDEIKMALEYYQNA